MTTADPRQKPAPDHAVASDADDPVIAELDLILCQPDPEAEVSEGEGVGGWEARRGGAREAEKAITRPSLSLLADHRDALPARRPRPPPPRPQRPDG